MFVIDDSDEAQPSRRPCVRLIAIQELNVHCQHAADK